MIVIGVTGGISTGKSLVTSILREKQARVIDADETYHHLLATDETLNTALRRAFGDGVYGPDGRLDRRALGQRVFTDPEARATLNGIAHPAVRREMGRELDQARAAGEPVVYLSVPLLYEGGLDAMVDRVLVIAASPATQLARLMRRENIPEDDARRRIASQMPLDEKRRRAWKVIENEGSPEETRAQIEALHAALLAESAG